MIPVYSVSTATRPRKSTHLLAAVGTDAAKKLAPAPAGKNNVTNELEAEPLLRLAVGDGLRRVAAERDKVSVLQRRLRFELEEWRDVLLDESGEVEVAPVVCVGRNCKGQRRPRGSATTPLTQVGVLAGRHAEQAVVAERDGEVHGVCAQCSLGPQVRYSLPVVSSHARSLLSFHHLPFRIAQRRAGG